MERIAVCEKHVGFETALMMNEAIEIPEEMRKHYYLDPIYDRAEFIARNVIRRYGGCQEAPGRLAPFTLFAPRKVARAGHAAQNVLLQAIALDLAAVPIGAFQDDEVRHLLALPRAHRPLYLVPIGRPAR